MRASSLAVQRAFRKPAAAQFARRHGSGRAFTLIELLVVIAIIAVLVAVLLPVLGRARATAKLAVCGGNLRQIGTAIYTYAHEYRGYIPRGPDPVNPYDFYSNMMATNQIWIGDGTQNFPTAHPREYMGQGKLLVTTCPQPAVLYCPADGNFNQGIELPRIGTEQHAFGSYMYRELDRLPADAATGQLDRLGANKVRDVPIPVEALALDTNSLGPEPYHQVNHEGKEANVLFRDGSVREFHNASACLAVPESAFSNPALIPSAIDQLLTNADYAYRFGLPAQAPQIPPG